MSLDSTYIPTSCSCVSYHQKLCIFLIGSSGDINFLYSNSQVRVKNLLEIKSSKYAFLCTCSLNIGKAVSSAFRRHFYFLLQTNTALTHSMHTNTKSHTVAIIPATLLLNSYKIFMQCSTSCIVFCMYIAFAKRSVNFTLA